MEGQHPDNQYPQKQEQQHQQQQHANLVLVLNANDVLCGRGVPVIINQGNVRFRELVRSRKQEYMSNWRHQIKRSIALKIYAEVQRRQGRFLRLIESAEDKVRLGLAADVKAWEIISEEDAVEKTKQALRGKDGNRTPVMTVSAALEPPLGYPQPPPPPLPPSHQQQAQLSMMLPSLAGRPTVVAAVAAATNTTTAPSFDVYTLQILIGLQQQQQQQAMRQAAAQMPAGSENASAPAAFAPPYASMTALSNLSHHSPSVATSTRQSNQLDVLLGRTALPAGASRENWQGFVGNASSRWPGAGDARILNHSNTNSASSWPLSSTVAASAPFASFDTAATVASTMPASGVASLPLSSQQPPPVQQPETAEAATPATPSLRPSVGRPLAPPPPPSPTRIVPPGEKAAAAAVKPLTHEDGGVALESGTLAPVNHVCWTNSSSNNGRTSVSAATTASTASTLSTILDLLSTSSAAMPSTSSNHSHAVLSDAATTTTSAQLLELLPYIQEAAAAVAHADRQSHRLEAARMNPGHIGAMDVGRAEFAGVQLPPIPPSMPPTAVLERLAQCVQAVDSLGDDEVHRLLAGYLREQARSSPHELALADRVPGALLPPLPPLPTNDHLYLPNHNHHRRGIHNEADDGAGAATAVQPRLLPRLPPQRRASTIAAATATATASLVGPPQPLQQLSPHTTSRSVQEESEASSSVSLLRASSPTTTARMPSREANGSTSDDHHPYSPRLNLLVEAALEHVTDSATRTSSVSELASVDSATAVLTTVQARSTMTTTRARMESDSPSIENGDSSRPSTLANDAVPHSTNSSKRQRT